MCPPASTFLAACPSYILGRVFVLGKNKQPQQQKKGGITAIHFKPSVFKIDGGDQPCNPLPSKRHTSETLGNYLKLRGLGQV